MVDSVGAKPFTVGERSIGRVDRAPAPRAIDTAKPPVTQAPAPSLRGIARELASAPPVDSDRVSRIRQAIANDTFPILPATIADRLLAFKMNWNGNDQA
ncbi:flagellar biosynthesis anti-sigma factor FlgM [uncultured Sphingomonas sp.]|uniref:flagellar biosynthesis anti-sigma factor FlgM n=1 Tax=uncultured Sphingomonas sp. TaxID=158754 RepID=UPI0035CCA19B